MNGKYLNSDGIFLIWLPDLLLFISLVAVLSGLYALEFLCIYF